MSDYGQSFDLVASITLDAEGGYLSPARAKLIGDNGGETKYGISKKAHPKVDVKNLTVDEARKIFFEEYWLQAKCDVYPLPLALAVFDFAINSGVPAAVRHLQNVLGVKVDGDVGPKTLAALRAAWSTAEGQDELMGLYLAARTIRLVGHEDWPTMGRGWLKRFFIIALEAGRCRHRF